MTEGLKKIDDTLDAFVKEMRYKLHSKACNEDFSGWDEMSEDEILGCIMRHLTEQMFHDGEEEVDIANFCMFLWYHNQQKYCNMQSTEDTK